MNEKEIMKAKMQGMTNREILDKINTSAYKIKKVSMEHGIRHRRGNFPEMLKPLKGKIIEKAIKEEKEVVI